MKRGFALVATLLVAALLSALALALLSLVRQERLMALHERDRAQLLHAAEGALVIARTWFHDPEPQHSQWKPGADEMTTALRRGAVFRAGYTNARERTRPESHAEVDASLGAEYLGGDAFGAPMTCAPPYAGREELEPWGRRATPDLLTCARLAPLGLGTDDALACTPSMTAFLERIGETFSVDAELRAHGHDDTSWRGVTLADIRVFRPPVDFDRRRRGGVATVEATAVKRRGALTVVARRTTSEVLAAIPYERPAGPIETRGPLSERALEGAHWGTVLADELSASASALGDGLPRSDGRPHVTFNPAAAVDLEATTPVVATALTELLGLTSGGRATRVVTPLGMRDPWRRVHVIDSLDLVDLDVPPREQPFPYSVTARRRWSHVLHRRGADDGWIDWMSWERVARSGLRGLHALEWTGGDRYREDGRGPEASWSEWARDDVRGPGVFLFLARDAEPDELPAHAWGTAPVRGVVLLEAGLRVESGGRTTRVVASMPGEPFLDDGLDLHDGSGVRDGCICAQFSFERGCLAGLRQAGGVAGTIACDADTLAAMDADVALREARTFRNGRWDSDLDDDGRADFGSSSEDGARRAFESAHGFAAGVVPHYPRERALETGREPSDRKRDPRFGEHLGDEDTRVHEPFLNLDYSADQGLAPWREDLTSRVDYRAGGELAWRRRDGTPVHTSRSRDALGGGVTLDVHLDGWLLSEGAWSGTADFRVHGAVLARAGAQPDGSVRVWFDPRIRTGAFPPPDWGLPRVVPTSRTAD